VLFHRNGKLLQVPFDLEKAEITGEPAFVADDLYWSPNNGMIMADVAATGDLVLGSTYVDRLTPGSSVEIWIADLQRLTLSILSQSGSDCWGGVFSPDGREYVYTSQDPGFERLYRQTIDGASPPMTLLDLHSVNTIADT
jgi:hypothetical protein